MEHELGKAPCLFGDCFTATDVMIGSMFIRKKEVGRPAGTTEDRDDVDRLLAGRNDED